MELPERGISGLKSVQIKFGFEREVVEFGCVFEQFEFDKSAQRSKEMIGAGGHRLCR